MTIRGRVPDELAYASALAERVMADADEWAADEDQTVRVVALVAGILYAHAGAGGA